jgi:hypothetical protein
MLKMINLLSNGTRVRWSAELLTYKSGPHFKKVLRNAALRHSCVSLTLVSIHSSLSLVLLVSILFSKFLGIVSMLSFSSL